MHRNTFTLTGPLKTVGSRLCSLVWKNPSVLPSRSGQLSDRFPPLLCVTSGGLFDITTGSCLALSTPLNSFRENNQGERLSGCLLRLLLFCKLFSCENTYRSARVPQHHRRWVGDERKRLVCAVKLHWKARNPIFQSHKLCCAAWRSFGRVKGSLQVNVQRFSFAV